MFGNLFDIENRQSEDSSKSIDVDDSLGTTNKNYEAASPNDDGKTSKKAVKMEPAPKPRPSSGLSGIRNRGATCYLNTLLQTLMFTPEFREALFSLEMLGNLEDRANPEAKVRVIPIQLQRLLVRLLLLNCDTVSTADLLDSFGWTNEEAVQQHDVQELNHILLNAVEMSLVGIEGYDLVSRLYRGSLVNQIICEACGEISEREETFLDINVPVSEYSGLEESLFATFVETELMNGCNQYSCGRCSRLVNARKGVRIRGLPPILTFAVSRFKYDLNKQQRFKDTKSFNFPMNLDMAIYSDKIKSPEDTEYELFSVLIHRGGSLGGHYHAYIRDIDNLATWLQQDCKSGDMQKRESDSPERFADDPIDIIRCLLRDQPNSTLPLQRLSDELKSRTGFTWKKSYGKKFGPVTKFLMKYDDVFTFDPHSQIIGLTKPSLEPKSKQKQNEIDSHANSFVINGENSSENCPPSGQCWFDFDDHKITPIQCSDIENQFEGYESAYILVYRRKSLQRPPEAFQNPYYLVPEKLIEMVDLENEELRIRRCEHEVLLNTIELKVHLGIHYRYMDGCLSPDPNVISFVTVSIDKRAFIDDLLMEIIKECGEDIILSDFTLTFAKELPAGLHLYDTITYNNQVSLQSIPGIEDRAQLFVWDGHKIGENIFLNFGAENEPVIVNLKFISAGNVREIPKVYSRNTSIFGLALDVGMLLEVLPDKFILKWVKSEADKTYVQLDLQDNSTLGALGYLDGDSILVELTDEMSEEEMIHNGSLLDSNTFTVKITNLCKIGERSVTDVREVEVEACANMSVFDLRRAAVHKLELPVNIPCRLRLIDTSLGHLPPLFEYFTLAEYAITNSSRFVLENGLPPSENEIMLNVKFPNGERNDVCFDRRASVADCTQKIVGLANLRGTAWQVRRLTRTDEPGKVIAKGACTFEELGIRHGDTILIGELSAPAVRVEVWFHPTLPSNFSNGLWLPASGNNSAVNEYMQLQEMCPKELTKLGDLEIPSRTTLKDVKCQILKLPALKNIPPPELGQIRLRLLQNALPTKILRGHSKCLRELKIVNGDALCVQLLPNKEDLQPNVIVLSVLKRESVGRCYSPPTELLLDCSISLTSRQLREAIADHCQMRTDDNILIAKRVKPGNYVVLDTQIDVSETSEDINRKKKSKLRENTCIKIGNLSLNDGDVLAIKDALNCFEHREDFSTAEEDSNMELAPDACTPPKPVTSNGNQNLTTEERNGKKRWPSENYDHNRQGCGASAASGRGNGQRKPNHSETTITIHVGDFS